MALLRYKRTERDSDILTDIAMRLADLRDECGLGVRDVAQHLGVSYGTVLAWEHGNVAFDVLSLYRLSRLFQCSPEFILTGHDPRNGARDPWASMGPAYGEEVWPKGLTAHEERTLTKTAHRRWYNSDEQP